MSSFGGRSERPAFADLVAYPSYLARLAAMRGPDSVDLLHAPKAKSDRPGALHKLRAAGTECADYMRIAADYQPGFSESFITSPFLRIIALAMLDEHYQSLEAYVSALVDTVRVEYETIVGHGLILQIDAPDLAAERHTTYANRPLKDFQEFVELIVARINRALEKIPRDRVRLHDCRGNYEGPMIATSRLRIFCRSWSRHNAKRC